MVVGTDAELFGVFASLQICPHYPIVHYIEERADTVPAFVVEPNLKRGIDSQFRFCKLKVQLE